MLSTMTYYATRVLWTGTGVSTVILGATVIEDWHTKALLMVTGLLTTLLSLLFGGFIKHLAGHQNDRNLIFADLDKKHDHLMNKLEATQSKETCIQMHTNLTKLMDVKLQAIDNKLTMALKKD